VVEPRPPSSGGIAWVENARGLLIHQVYLDQDRISSYRIVAPTEWNFHPTGALALALEGTHAGDLDAAKDRTTRLVHSLDPCVACHVEIDNA
jgi:Ni,Fe-hydrogenase I large subunit